MIISPLQTIGVFMEKKFVEINSNTICLSWTHNWEEFIQPAI